MLCQRCKWQKTFSNAYRKWGDMWWCPYHTEFWVEKTNSLPDFLCQTSRKHDSNQLYAIMNWVWKPLLRRHNRICIGHFLWKFAPGIWQCNLKIVSESWWIPFDRDYIQYSLILNTGLNILDLSYAVFALVYQAPSFYVRLEIWADFES